MNTNGKPGDGIATALRDLGNLAIDAEMARRDAVADYNAVVIPDNYNIHKLEGLSPWRDRVRGVYTTTMVDDFAKIANEHAATVRTFIDAREWTAAAVLNFREFAADKKTDYPGHCDYIARLRVSPSPEWHALMNMHGMKLAQRGLIDFLEDWMHCIPGFYATDGKSMTWAQALAAIREVKVQSNKTSFQNAREGGTDRGMLETIEARDFDKWPATFDWACTPALGLQPIKATVRLAVLSSHDTPTIAARIIGVDALREHVANAFAVLLQSKLDVAPFNGHFDAGA